MSRIVKVSDTPPSSTPYGTQSRSSSMRPFRPFRGLARCMIMHSGTTRAASDRPTNTKGGPTQPGCRNCGKRGAPCPERTPRTCSFSPSPGCRIPACGIGCKIMALSTPKSAKVRDFANFFLSFPFISSSRRLVFRRFSEYRRLVAAHVLRLPRPLPQAGPFRWQRPNTDQCNLPPFPLASHRGMAGRP